MKYDPSIYRKQEAKEPCSEPKPLNEDRPLDHSKVKSFSEQIAQAMEVMQASGFDMEKGKDVEVGIYGVNLDLDNAPATGDKSPAKFDKLMIGKVVRVKSGGPRMTVSDQVGNQLKCVWFDQLPNGGWKYEMAFLSIQCLDEE